MTIRSGGADRACPLQHTILRKEKLLHPSRNERNGYRDYSESDVEDLKKIAYLRTLG